MSGCRMGSVDIMAKKTASVSFEIEVWDALQVEADKRKISRNELVGRICNDLIAGNPIISQVVDLDKELKQKQINIATERHRKLKNDNDYFDKHQYYPTKPANYVTRVIETPPTQKEWIGEKYQPTKPQTQVKEETYEPSISLDEWKLVFPTLTEFDKSKNMYFCAVADCHHGCQNAETARRHIIDNHESILQSNLRELLKP